MISTAAYLLACLIVAVLGIQSLVKMSRRTQHLRRAAFALCTAGALVPVVVLLTHAASMITTAAAAEALAAVSASAQVSGTFFACGLACLLLVGTRGQ
jgi:hypothetical protein